ncbi:MAG: glycosyltransferase family 4 protein [Patescibacteria group bacterium]|jgi:glycosyltransferase involved in cell wall biosynthesis
MKKYKIAIDVSPIYDGNSLRGIGHFTSKLIESMKTELKNNSDFNNFRVDFVTNKSSGRYDLIHYPFFDPFKLTLPNKSDIPTIVTVYDLIPRQFRKFFPVGLRGEINWQLQKNRLKKADYIITCSHYSKYVISDLTGYPQDQIYVTYAAADDSFKPINNKILLKKIKDKYKLPNKFILYVGDINWNKNIPSLLKACRKLNYPLVIVGSAATQKNVPDHPWTKDLRYLQSEHQKQSNQGCLVLTGFVPDEDLPVIYNLATVYCQPSYAEGFGIPLVQAMKSGCPVAYSLETSLPEVMDFNGEFFNPYSQREIQSALSKLWNNKKLRQQYTKDGLKRAQVFDWQLTALSTLSVYQLALQ